MKKGKTSFLVLFAISSVLYSFTNTIDPIPAPKNPLMAGTAKVNITPTTPIPMSGYGGRKDPFKGIHDEIFARVIVFSDGKNKAVLISLETVGISNVFWKDFTEKLEKKTGIKKEFVFAFKNSLEAIRDCIKRKI